MTLTLYPGDVYRKIRLTYHLKFAVGMLHRLHRGYW
jgi:hypothetical protein